MFLDQFSMVLYLKVAFSLINNSTQPACRLFTLYLEQNSLLWSGVLLLLPQLMYAQTDLLPVHLSLRNTIEGECLLESQQGHIQKNLLTKPAPWRAANLWAFRGIKVIKYSLTISSYSSNAVSISAYTTPCSLIPFDIVIDNFWIILCSNSS